MALKGNFELDIYGKVVKFDNCYMKIERFSGDKNNLSILLNIYDEDKLNTIESKSYRFKRSIEDNSSNFIKQGYEYLKSLVEYSSCEDVLEF